MSYKTILVHGDASEAVSHRLGVAIGLAERFNARLVGFHARRPFEPPVGFGAPNRLPMADLLQAYEAATMVEDAAASAAFAESIRGKTLSTEWRVVDGYVEAELIAEAHYADLVVVGQADPDPSPTPSDLPEAVALATGRPILVVPRTGAPKPPGKVVMLCWKASREAARAASDALPLLRGADKVVVLTIGPGHSASRHGKEPGAAVAAWLSGHGVTFAIERQAAPDADAASVILSRAAAHGVDLIVMGAYGHSQVRELVLGGVSRTMLASMTVPILMAH